jgi:adenylate cyclase
VDTALTVTGGAVVPPASSPELRAMADERGVALTRGSDGRGVIVVPIRAEGLTVKGYVTIGLDLAVLGGLVAQVADERFREGVRIAVVDGEKHAVALNDVPSFALGADVSPLPIWTAVPAGIPWDRPLGVVNEFDEGGEPMVGTVRTISAVGWAVAIWRPQAQAYATLDTMRQTGGLVAAGAFLFALLAGLLAARAVTAPVLAAAKQAPLIAARRWREVRLESKRSDELGDLVRAMGDMAVELEAGEVEIAREAKLRTDLGRFLSKELVESIVGGRHDLALGGKRMMVTVLFADIVAFTPLAESRPAEYVVSLLNELFSVMSEVVFRHGGMIDKFIGDCLMAVWGAPVPDEAHASHALAAAEDMMRFLETAAVEWREKYGVEIRLGVGVNSGEVIVGNIGSDKRMEYTVVGDAVNVAARLEAIARPNQVLVGETTFDLVQGEFAMKLLGERKLTGRQKESKVYELETA